MNYEKQEEKLMLPENFSNYGVTSIISDVIVQDELKISYRPEWARKLGSTEAAILLQQIHFRWRINNKKPFYKFQEPCKHKLYKEGQSWCEELAFGVYEIRNALSKISLTAAQKKKLKKEESVEIKQWQKIVEWNIDTTRLTWYSINEAELNKFLGTVYLTWKNPVRKIEKTKLAVTGKNPFIKDTEITEINNRESDTLSEKDLSSTKKPEKKDCVLTQKEKMALLNGTPKQTTENNYSFSQEDEDGFRSRVEPKKVKTVDDWTAVDFRWHLKRKHEAAYGKGTGFEYAKKSRADGQVISKIKRTLIDKFLDTGLTKKDIVNYIDWVFGSDDGTVKGKCTRMKEGIVITLNFLASNNLIAEWMSGKNNGNGKSKYTEEQKQAVADMIRARTIN